MKKPARWGDRAGHCDRRWGSGGSGSADLGVEEAGDREVLRSLVAGTVEKVQSKSCRDPKKRKTRPVGEPGGSL